MKRRQLIRYAGASLLSATGMAWVSGFQPYQAQSKPTKSSNSLLVQWLGHTCFLLTGGGIRILVNPFRTLGCTAGYRLPKVEADLVLISSQLWDEGAAENLPGNPKILYEPGVYEINGFKFQGISIAHDRQGGKRFGINVARRWTQAGLKILHLGGAAAPIEIEQKILMGSPDLAFIPVGGGPKAYNPEEAKKALEAINPRVMIPTQFLTTGADKNACDLVGVEQFLELVKDMNVKIINDDKLMLQAKDLPKEGTLIRVLSYKNALKPTEKPSKPTKKP
jgi:L-ascorbate metabolism protein UlaG (beta-lactamase superfamily)